MDIVKQRKIHKTTTLKPTTNEPTKNYFTNFCGDCIDRTNFTRMKKYTIALIWTTAIGLIAMVLFSCSASYHFGKFIKKGGTIDTTERIVTATKTIKVNGKDSIILVEMPLNCPEVQIPPTRYETRLEYRLKRDSIQTVRYVTKWKTKEVIKLAKTQNKKPFNWFWIGLGIGLLIPILIKFAINKI